VAGLFGYLLDGESVDGRLRCGWKVFGGVDTAATPIPIVYTSDYLPVPRSNCFYPMQKSLHILIALFATQTLAGSAYVWGSFTPLPSAIPLLNLLDHIEPK
jgi:hypothetical protein